MSGTVRPFVDLRVAEPTLEEEIRKAIERVVRSARFVLGPEVRAFEAELATAVSCRYGVGVACGTDAITLALAALGIGRGDEVITTPVTAAFTALGVSRSGARPVFADVREDTLLLDPAKVEERLTSRTRAIVPVHLYGNACNLDALLSVAEAHGLAVVEDACQAHGARLRGRPLGSFGRAAAFSFYPTKNLGALGDGGMVVTNDRELGERVRRLRNGGQSSRYVHEEVGLNSRLDEIQAAVLRAKLPRLEEWNRRRRALAERYRAGLRNTPVVPVTTPADADSAAHLFVVRAPRRDALRHHLHERGVETLIHYPVPTHLQPAYRTLGQLEGSCPVAEQAAEEVVSLPLHPALGEGDVQRVIEAIGDFYSFGD